MGRSAARPETSIQHFSHSHPLQLSNYQPQQTLSLVSCSACHLNLSAGWIYTCTYCNYFLHISCSQFPQQITHPFDQNHVLCLIPIPAYPQGRFNCDACGKKGHGFSYHCKTCNIDLHTSCAAMPMIIKHLSHNHQLGLTFSVPYVNKMFNCDICHDLGSNQWIYRCNMCEYDAHLGCAIVEPKLAGVQIPSQQVQTPIQQCQQVHYRRVPTAAITQFQVAENPLAASLTLQSSATNSSVSNVGTYMPPAVARSNQFGIPLSNQRLMRGLLHMAGAGGIDLGSIIGGGASGGAIDFGSVLGGGGIDLGGLGLGGF